MTSYAFWNNKGGVGKSFLCFVAGCEYAEKHPNDHVYIIDLCPQANVSETLLGGVLAGAKNLTEITSQVPRRTIGGYLEARLSSPFQPLPDLSMFVVEPHTYNKLVPKNVRLVAGDNFVELLSEPIRQASQLSLPLDAWKKVIGWVSDLVTQLKLQSGNTDTVFFIDCNPSFSIYTQQALIAAESLIIPFTPDESSRRGVENVAALLYGLASSKIATYARLSFAARAEESGVPIPKLRHFVNNRVTIYEGKPSKAFAAASKGIKETVDGFFKAKRSLFQIKNTKPSSYFIDIPDNHSANIVCALSGTPLSKLKAGPHEIRGERIQVNVGPLNRYKTALTNLVKQL